MTASHMICSLKTAVVIGVEAVPIEVEVTVSGGLPGMHLVGLPMAAVREGGVRIKSALTACAFDMGSVQTTVNLAPADIRKEGAAFDLPIALGCLGARELIAIVRDKLLIAGELSLDGRLRPIRGALSLAELVKRNGYAGLLVPHENAAEASLVHGVTVYGVLNLIQAAHVLAGVAEGHPFQAPTRNRPNTTYTVDFAEVRGQPEACRAAEIAAAGGHNLLLLGPPGVGKTMIARRIPTILPAMSENETIEATKIHSIAGVLGSQPLLTRRPFRAPHHTCSGAGLVGGGPHPRPGEVSLAHHGVLFLDELPQFRQHVIEGLRQPLEDGVVSIVRARQVVNFPAQFMLVAAMNPCPCGYRGSAQRTCTCGEGRARRYIERLSGPLLDRFDLFVTVRAVPTSQVFDAGPSALSSKHLQQRVESSRDRQRHRYRNTTTYSNAQMNTSQLEQHAALTDIGKKLLTQYAEARQISARVLQRTRRVARTIADLYDSNTVSEEHLMLALTLQQSRWT